MNDVTGHIEDQPPIDYFDDLAPAAPSEATIERLTGLKTQSMDLAERIQQMSIDLAELQEEQVKILRVSIPSIMEELQITEFKMQDGAVISLADSINASIKEENRPSAFRWLTEHDYDGIIKTKVVSEFGKGEIDDARKAKEAVEKAGFMCSLDQNIHPATLKSFVKERLEAGEKLPMEFSVFQFKEAKIKTPKARAKKK